MHPIDMLYTRLTNTMDEVVAADVSTNIDLNTSCSDCGRSPQSWKVPLGMDAEDDDFERQAFVGRDSYGVPVQRCPSCHSLYVGSVKVLGVERMAGKSGIEVPGKYGMLPQTGVCVDQNSVTLVGPEKTNKKIPQSFPHTLINATGTRKLQELIMRDHVYPALIIDDFGKKKSALINNLKISLKRESILSCSAEGVTEYNQVAIRNLLDLLSPLKSSDIRKWATLVRHVCDGKINTDDKTFQQFARDHHQVIRATAELPDDPHDRVANAALIQMILTK